MSIKSLFKTKKRIALLILVILIITAILWNIFGPKNIPEEQQYKVKRTTLENTISFAGEINAEEKATLQFQTGGRLVWVGVKEGDIVMEGQGIAQLDTAQMQKNMQRYLNTYGKARNAFDQSKDDNADQIPVTETDTANEYKRIFENSQLDLNNAVLDVELQQLAMQYSYLATPISGIVTRVDAPKPGVNITSLTTFEVINPSTVYFSATIDQTDLPSIQQGKTGKVTLDAYPEKPVDGTLSFISFTPKEGETGTVYEAKVLLSNPNAITYRLGMTGDVTFILGKKENALVIPLRFLKTEGDSYFVTKKTGNGSEKVEIEIGEEYSGDIEVIKGLEEGDIIYVQQ